jgi:hypothetical protein
MFHPHPFHHGDAHAVLDGWSGPKTNPSYDVFASPSPNDELEASNSLHGSMWRFVPVTGWQSRFAKMDNRADQGTMSFVHPNSFAALLDDEDL